MTRRTLIDMQNITDNIMEPREIVRDPDGMLIHPAIPVFDEGVDMRLFFAAIGIDVRFVSMESDCDDEAVLNAYFDDGEPGCERWTPTRPDGDGWLLLEIFDTEDGPHAMFGRRDPAVRLRYAAPAQPVERQELSDNAIWEVYCRHNSPRPPSEWDMVRAVVRAIIQKDRGQA